jgi:hypothetical protein
MLRKALKLSARPELVIPTWATAGVVLSSWGSAFWGLLGIPVWCATEYLFHRFAQHGLAHRFPRFYKSAHGVHHQYPQDVSHFCIPLAFTLPVVGVLLTLAMWLGPPGVAALGGMLLTYAWYDCLHLGCHGFGPRWWLRYCYPWAMAHAKHHVDARTVFSVSVPWFEAGGPPEGRR